MGQKQCILFSMCFMLVGLVLQLIMTKAYTGWGGDGNEGMAQSKKNHMASSFFLLFSQF